MNEERTRFLVDEFYKQNGPCCAGCDFWRYHSFMIGDCIKTAPISRKERRESLGRESCSLKSKAGHIITSRSGYCDKFRDSDNPCKILKLNKDG